MSELSDLQVVAETPSPFKTARVISVSGHSLTVDFGSGAGGTVIQSTDSCNPVPDQTVLIAMDGRRPVAVGALGGPYRQATMIATGSSSTTATGVVNGVSKAVTKMGSFTVTNGDELPLIWAPDGSEVWVAAKAGVAYTPPSGGSGGSGGGSTPGSYTTSYAASSSGWYSNAGAGNGTLQLASGRTGYFNYGTNRMNELQGKTIVSGRIYLVRSSGSGSISLRALKGSTFSSTQSTSAGGWLSLSSAVVSGLVAGTGATAVRITGSGNINGIPGGTIQITWK